MGTEDTKSAQDISIIVINMDRDHDRLAYIQNQIEAQGLTFERFAGVSGDDLPPALDRYFPPDQRSDGFLSKGDLGCYASHLLVYQALAEGKIASPALVLEDDVRLPPNMLSDLQQIVHVAPSGWDLIRLSSPVRRAYVSVKPLRTGRLLVRYLTTPPSNGALLVSAAGARKFLKPVARTLPIDQDNRCPWRFELNVLGVTPEFIHSDTLPTSTIDALSGGRSRANKAYLRELNRRMQFWRRHFYSIGEFGFRCWLASTFVNLLAQLQPKQNRSAFLQRASFWLARIAASARVSA